MSPKTPYSSRCAGPNPGRRSILAQAGFAAVIVCVLLGCGYRMAGSGNLPGGIRTLAVHALENRTVQTGLGVTVTNALITEFHRRRKGALAPSGRADAVLTGTLVSLAKETISRRGERATTERQVTLRVALTLKHADGRVLWQKQDLEEKQAYSVDDADQAGTDIALRQAVDQVAQRLAETVVRQLSDDF